MDDDQVLLLLEDSLKQLVAQDIYLLERNLHERTITHKLAEILQPLFPEWNVDCEYNRDGHDSKRVKIDSDPIPDAQLDAGSNVFPDIIIHHRGNNEYNLLIIEAKKRHNFNGCIDDYDRKKIEAFKADLHYRCGAAITFFVGEVEGERIEIFFYSGGNWRDPIYI